MDKTTNDGQMPTPLTGLETQSTLQDSVDSERPKTGACFLAPMPGFVWNPLRKLPKNMACPCLSGKKFKACCLPKLQPAVPIEVAETYKNQIASGELVFLTPENQHKLKDRIPKEIWDQKEAELKAARDAALEEMKKKMPIVDENGRPLECAQSQEP